MDFLAFLPTIPPGDIQVFSDGSKRESTDGSTGCGSISFQYGLQTTRKTLSLGRYVEVFDAEALGALEGARAAIASPGARLATNL